MCRVGEETIGFLVLTPSSIPMRVEDRVTFIDANDDEVSTSRDDRFGEHAIGFDNRSLQIWHPEMLRHVAISPGLEWEEGKNRKLSVYEMEKCRISLWYFAALLFRSFIVVVT